MTFTAEPNIGPYLVEAPATKRYKPDLDLRTQSLMNDGYTEAMINSDRQMWGGSPISFPNDPQWNK